MNFAAAVYADFACYLVQWQVDMVTMLEKAINYVQCLELQIRVRLLEMYPLLQQWHRKYNIECLYLCGL